jgi:hypothetical protein
MIVAQQFTAGIRLRDSQSVKRTADVNGQISAHSAVRFTDFPP